VIWRAFLRQLDQGFFANFIVFFGVGHAFSKLTRPAREQYGWAVTAWDFGELNYVGAGSTLGAWLIGVWIGRMLVRRFSKRKHRFA
jgi:hypothetical protein